ncbi:hypothetical protein [Nonomuraea sp. NPDC049784]|uniref:hypothetical protein n=1 Tax=Nonomuraea sp. NPDC049784 TaxID=3154361 RepID=UPI0033FAC695
MWQRRLNWAAVALVAIFGLMWVGVVLYADPSSSLPMQIVQVIFGLVLLGWAAHKAFSMIRTYDEEGWNR